MRNLIPNFIMDAIDLFHKPRGLLLVVLFMVIFSGQGLEPIIMQTWDLLGHVFLILNNGAYSLWPVKTYGTDVLVNIRYGNGIGSCGILTPNKSDTTKPQGTYFNEIFVDIQKFLLTKMHSKKSPVKCQSCCHRHSVLIHRHLEDIWVLF